MNLRGWQQSFARRSSAQARAISQCLELVVPFDSKLLEQIIELQSEWLSTLEYAFDDRWREQGKTQDPPEVGFVDASGFSDVANRGVAT